MVVLGGVNDLGFALPCLCLKQFLSQVPSVESGNIVTGGSISAWKAPFVDCCSHLAHRGFLSVFPVEGR